MKTLFERLRPEQRERLQELKKEMPFTQDSLVKTLKRYKFVIDLPFGDCLDIVRFLGERGQDFSTMRIYDCFQDFNKTGDDPSLQSDHNAQTTNT